MTALYIICGVVLLFALILLVPVGIELRYDGEIALDAKIAFVRIALVPKRRKKIKLRKFSKKRFGKMLAKEEKKEEKKAAKKSAHKDEAVPEKKPEATAEKKAEKKPKLVSDLWEMRSLLIRTVGAFIHRIRTKVARICVTIGSEDAAKSALLYGAVSQFAVYILEILRSQTKMAREGEVVIGVDFTSEKTRADVDVRLSICVGSVIAVAIGFGVGYFKHRINQD